jgi:transcriptional regulator of heat shock response
MERVTINEIEEILEKTQKIIDMQGDEISRLHKELDDTMNELSLVSRLEQQNNKAISILETRVQLLIKQNKANEKKNSEMKTEDNSTGAGENEFQDYDTVKRIFNLFSNGENLQSIANSLNEGNVKIRNGGKWTKDLVRFILLNHTYVEKGVINEKMFGFITKHVKRNH